MDTTTISHTPGEWVDIETLLTLSQDVNYIAQNTSKSYVYLYKGESAPPANKNAHILGHLDVWGVLVDGTNKVWVKFPTEYSRLTVSEV